MSRRSVIAALAVVAATVLFLVFQRLGDKTESDATSAAQWFTNTAAALARSQSHLDSRRTLAELRAQLAILSPSNASAAIIAALKSGIDARTGLDLKPAGNGRLADASSLRVFLLDELIARDPAAAREIARRILETFTTPDEWAIALAACATDTSETGVDFLRGKSRAMVQHEAWQQNPTAGFLEAFDVFVFTRDTEFAPQLASFVNQTNNRAIAHAAYLTLDRLVIGDPVPVLETLVSRPELLSAREATRAGYFARADVREPKQREITERYLLNPKLSARELEHFAGTFPNGNFIVSENLLTRSTTPDTSSLRASDSAALTAVNEWLADPRFAKAAPLLRQTRTRLEQHLR